METFFSKTPVVVQEFRDRMMINKRKGSSLFMIVTGYWVITIGAAIYDLPEF
jgi:hypothetical protein